MPIICLAPAKLNLMLHITGKREDGYHVLQSLVAFTQFGDRLECFDSEHITLELAGPLASSIEADERNLVMRAARLLKKHAGTQRGAHMVLHKHIPVGAGNRWWFGGCRRCFARAGAAVASMSIRARNADHGAFAGQ